VAETETARIEVGFAGGQSMSALITASSAEELERAFGVLGDRSGVDPPLEPRARLAAQLQPLRAAGDPHALEVGRLEQDLRGGIGHLGGGAAHDAGDRLRRAFGVADQQVFAGERALDAVEGGHGLAVLGEPHDDAAPGEPGEVERVQRLVALEQHVVGHVDHVADRAHPRLDEALCHPRG